MSFLPPYSNNASKRDIDFISMSLLIHFTMLGRVISRRWPWESFELAALDKGERRETSPRLFTFINIS